MNVWVESFFPHLLSFQVRFRWWCRLVHSAGELISPHTSSSSWTLSTTMAKSMREFPASETINVFQQRHTLFVTFPPLLLRILPVMWTIPYTTSSRWWAKPTGPCWTMRVAVSSCVKAPKRYMKLFCLVLLFK